MKLEDIKAEVKKAQTEGKQLKVVGYINSKGEVADLIVEFLPKDGYKMLVEESLKMLAENPPAYAEVEEYSAEAWANAHRELAESFQKTLKGEHPERKRAEVKPDDDFLSIYSLRGVERILDEETKAPVKRKSSPKVIAKAAIRSKLPICQYIGQLKLAENKVQYVEAL
jgi:hypothetical protein